MTDRTAEVVKKPKCDFCSSQAEYDGKTIQGPWAYMCEADFHIHGVGLGMDQGQRLVFLKDGEK